MWINPVTDNSIQSLQNMSELRSR